jgi:hypothetical protein
MTELEELRARVAWLESMQEALVEWVQQDCPYSRDEILELVGAEARAKEASA